MEKFFPVDVNRVYEKVLLQDQREAVKIFGLALDAGYMNEFALSIVYKAGQEKGNRELRKCRRKLAALRKENSELLELMLKQNAVPANIHEIMKAVNDLEIEPTPGVEKEDCSDGE